MCELHKNMLFYASNVSEISMAIKLCLRAHDGLFYLFSTVVVILLKNIYIDIYIYVYVYIYVYIYPRLE